MLLECLRRRAAGTQVELNGNTYDFQPNKAGAHVCEVDDTTDLKRLLQIDAYVPYEPGKPAAKAVPKQEPEPIKPAVPESGAPTLEPKQTEPEQNDGGTGPDPVDPGTDETDESDTGDDEQEEVNLEDLSDDELREEYIAVVGTKPGRLGRDKQIAAIIAKADGAE